MCMTIFGGITNPNRLETSDDLVTKPDNMDEPPMNVFCPRCEHISQAVYRQTYKTWICCFIPFPPVEYQNPFLACSRCGSALEKLPQEPCSKCKVVTPFTSEFCPKCGNKKPVPFLGTGSAGQEEDTQVASEGKAEEDNRASTRKRGTDSAHKEYQQ